MYHCCPIDILYKFVSFQERHLHMLLFQQQKYLLENYTLFIQLLQVKVFVGLQETSIFKKTAIARRAEATEPHIHTDGCSLI